MDSQEVGELLEQCLQAAATTQQSTQPREDHCYRRDSLCEELASLLQEAMDMRWPFAPEKWQFKQSVSTNDKTNLSELISKHLPQLLAFLKASIVAQEARSALAVIFLVDRFLYWMDESSQLLKITKLLHKRHPDVPVAPQLVIRQARVSLNSGKLEKAEYILSSLINNSGATGCWVYQSESDRALVQAVCVQVRGIILQKLGLWREAAELIWSSLVGFYSLPKPDKKGIGTSLMLLANILVSMTDEEFLAFRTNPDIKLLSLLGNVNHRLLSAAQAAKMAVVYCQYTSLYVLNGVVTQGTCLLSYSFSVECPTAQRQSFLQQTREAFSIGLLTTAEDKQVTSKQELYTFLKAAYSLTITHKWLGTAQCVVAKATKACQEALASLYDYCHADNQDKDHLCSEIMQLVAQVKHLLQVEPFLVSDKGSFIPDSYRNIADTKVDFTLADFSKLIRRYQKHHASVCETTSSNCKGIMEEMDGAGLCITAMGTTASTECQTEANKVARDKPKKGEADLSGAHPPQKPNQNTTLDSCQSFSLCCSVPSGPNSNGFTGSGATQGGAIARTQSCPTTEYDDNILLLSSEDKQQEHHNSSTSVKSHTVPEPMTPANSSSKASSDSERFQGVQAELETLYSEEAQMTDKGVGQSSSPLTLESSFSSLSVSFSSSSSWEKISKDVISPTSRKPQTFSLSKVGTGSKSPGSDGSFVLLGSDDDKSTHSMRGSNGKQHMNEGQCRVLFKPQNHNIDPHIETEVDSASVEPAIATSSATPHPNLAQCASTEVSTDSSFDIVEMSEVPSSEKVTIVEGRKTLCYSCIRHSIVNGVAPERQYLLSQRDYEALLAGVCHDCLLNRLQSEKYEFKLTEHRAVYRGLHLKFSKAQGLWTAKETCMYIGEPMGMKGSQRTAIWVQFLHQEEILSSYVGKDYLKPKQIQFHLKDVERQMTAQYYVTEFNKSLRDKDVMAQIYFIPSEALLILDGDEIVGCLTVEPFMLGDFVKLTNNTVKKEESYQATKYGLAFGHFTYLFSGCQEVVVDLQGWVTANGKGLTYLTDPQIHSIKIPRGPANFATKGLQNFLEKQHGPTCNNICQLLKLPLVVDQPHVRYLKQ